MGRGDVVETKTYDFNQMLRDQAKAATHPAAIAPLIALAQQAGSNGTARALQRVEKALTKQLAKDERRTAKERAKLDRAATERDRELDRAVALKGKTWDDLATARPAEQVYTAPTVERKASAYAKPGETREEWLRRWYDEHGVDYDRHGGTYVSCTSGEYGNPTPACMRSIVD